MDKLFSPWRLRYIRSSRRPRGGCIFCAAWRRRDDARGLVLERGRRNFVILNKYPYNNGHLMVVPREHVGSLAGLSVETLYEMMSLAGRCERALRRVYRPSGINLGMNLGRSAGAGIEGHLHLHLVPRWDGDTNFMTVVHGTRVIPEALGTTWRRLRPLVRGGASSRPRRAVRRGRR